ncbi:MAG: helix-turn-helix transcriptional regulator [Caldilineaceae bacterium]|jgi:predicted transcriptional regulator
MRQWVLSELMTLDQFKAELYFLVSRFGSQQEAAQEWGISESYLSDVLNGRRKPGAKFCKAVGYERVMMFVDTRIGVSGVRE